jgi:hypothetical protein
MTEVTSIHATLLQFIESRRDLTRGRVLGGDLPASIVARWQVGDGSVTAWAPLSPEFQSRFQFTAPAFYTKPRLSCNRRAVGA